MLDDDDYDKQNKLIWNICQETLKQIVMNTVSLLFNNFFLGIIVSLQGSHWLKIIVRKQVRGKKQTVNCENCKIYCKHLFQFLYKI